MNRPFNSSSTRVIRLVPLLILAIVPFALGAIQSLAAAAPISFNKDIRPILSENCFFCHGPDAGKRKGKLRLDVRDDVLAKKAIVPGKPAESELIRRINTSDVEDAMPPAESNKKLTPAQKQLLRNWIASGAPYEGHWAYIPPQKPAIPSSANPIDHLIRARLKQVGLKPSPEADRRTLIRRLYFDLIGLPPTPEEVESFQSDRSPEAYTRLVESLLSKPQFGERMAIGWLDVVRFADTIGYHSDNPRNIWPYRDYVINSFNDNKPFDVFTREQLAGDLLPQNGQEQKVGSAFNRLLLSTEEGGAQPKDYEARMLTDRVRAVGAVWLGQTIGCAQCHDHKFDPITSRDFYSMGAFFAGIQEAIVGGREPGMLVPDKAQAVQLAKLDVSLKSVEKQFADPHPELDAPYATWLKEQELAAQQEKFWTLLAMSKSSSANGAKLETKPDSSVLVTGKKPEKDTYTLTFTNPPAGIRGLRIEALPDDSLPSKGPGRHDNGNFVLTEVIGRIQETNGTNSSLVFSSAKASFEQSLYSEENPYKLWNAASVIDGDVKGTSFGWAILPETGKPNQLILELKESPTIPAGAKLVLELKQNHTNPGHTLGKFRIAVTTNETALKPPFSFPLAKEIADLIAVPADQRDKAQQEKLREEFKKVTPALESLRSQIASARKEKSEFEATVPRCIVSIQSEKPRTVRILPRGNFLVETGDIVQPALPGYLKASYSKLDKKKLDRLDLANWLVSRENPLTARVTMNRLWKQFFGVGLAKNLDDFGAQGESPRNQELLDWLASEFMDSGWDMKHMVRLMVTSTTYKQSSKPSAKARAMDPYNREFSSQGRWRLDAELVRDNALAVSGLLDHKIGGPSAKPYQPDGYWENLNFPTRNWERSTGNDQYRRGLYTWWQRSYLQPSMVAFDAPTREECVAERNRSNIPQQALVLLNDPTYVEASRALALRILKEGGTTPDARLRWAWRQVLNRDPRSDELKSTQALLKKHSADYQNDSAAAEAFLKVGQLATPEGASRAELAAWTSVSRVLLNLHESITRN